MKFVIIPAANVPELSEIPEHVRAKVEIVPAKTMRDVLEVALVRMPRRSAGAGTPARATRTRSPSARA